MTLEIPSQSDNSLFSISATFTIESIQSPTQFLMQKLALPFNAEVAPYHQVFQQLLDPFSQSGANSSGVNLFIIRLEDFVRDIDGAEQKRQQIASILVELTEAFGQYLSRTKVATVVFLLPASPRLDAQIGDYTNAQTAQLAEQLSRMAGVVVVQPEKLLEFGFDAAESYDSISDDLGHVPFNDAGYAALAIVAVRYLHLLKTTAKKVLVLDCDNTIWKGVVGEDGVDGIQLTSGMLALQRFAVNVQSQGVLICLASKNAEADVLEVFEKRPDMILKAEHLVAHRINWIPKYQNLESLAAELNLGLDSFVFVDDNPVECGQMREVLPQVLTLQLSDNDEAIETMLRQLWVFDKLAVTEEDAKRTQMYRENNARQQLESSATDIGAFLASLNLEITVSIPSEEEWPRVAQLTQRTNQFNFTTVRRNETEMRVLASQSEYHVLKVNVRDRFGDYGLVGDMVAKHDGDTLWVDTFLLSCRVLGRGVEHAMLRELAMLGARLGCSSVAIPYSRTAKNEPARAFADQVMGEYREGDHEQAVYRVPVTVLQETIYIPGTDPEAVMEAKRSETKKKTVTTGIATSSSSDRYLFLTALRGAQDLLDSMRRSSVRVRDLESLPIMPEGEDERRMLALWEALFGIQGLGMEDDYFALGGTSLMAARLFAEIAREFGQRLRLTVILEAPTPRKLLSALMPAQSSLATRGLIELKTGHGRKLFLIHDGDGETLLYMNLTRYLPSDVAVYGVEPRSLPNIPLAHNSIEEMADYYIRLIKQTQAEGPYYLGGMCAGGLLAYVVATRMQSRGDVVNMVAMLDAAVPHAPKQFAIESQARAGRVQQLLAEAKQLQSNIISKCLFVAKGLSKKVINTLGWMIYFRYLQVSKKLRFQVLRHVLSTNSSWPNWLKPMSVREIYNSAEDACHLPVSSVKTVLIKATSGEGHDIAYRFVYADEDFGWRKFATSLDVIDTSGGHASMLQEPYVNELAQILNKYFSAHEGR